MLEADAELRTFYLPIEGFELELPLDIGPLRVLPPEMARRLVEGSADPEWHKDSVDRILGVGAPVASAVGEIMAPSIDEALRLVDEALSVFRVFQLLQSRAAHNAMFALPGQLARSVIHYRSVGPPGSFGGKSEGEVLGFKLGEHLRSAWESSDSFQFVAGAVGVVEPTQTQQRALIGVRLLSRAILERIPDMRVLLNVMALEAMLLDRRRNAQTLVLARRLAFLACGSQDGCVKGMGFACAALALDPANRRDRKAIERLIELSREVAGWQCTRWLRVIAWYDVRSEIAHSGAGGIDDREAMHFGYWARVMYADPALRWFAQHPESPLSELDAAIATLPQADHNWHDAIATGEFPGLADEGPRDAGS